MGAEARLAELGLSLPPAPPPMAIYVPAVRVGELLFISGQLPLQDGQVAYTGKVGREVGVEQGQRAARLATLNALAAARAEVGSLDKIACVARLVGHVASAEGFTDQHLVVNGASQLLGDVFGEAGRHARLALGAFELPLRASVEIELILAVAD